MQTLKLFNNVNQIKQILEYKCNDISKAISNKIRDREIKRKDLLSRFGEKPTSPL